MIPLNIILKYKTRYWDRLTSEEKKLINEALDREKIYEYSIISPIENFLIKLSYLLSTLFFISATISLLLICLQE